MILTRLEDFILQTCDNGGHEGSLGIGKEGDGGDQGPTVEVDHVLMMMMMRGTKDGGNREINSFEFGFGGCVHDMFVGWLGLS